MFRKESTMDNTISVERIDGRRKSPLLMEYKGQTQPQPAYVYLDPEQGRLYADWYGESGNAMPADIWHGRRLRFRVSPYLSGKEVNQLLADLQELTRVVAIHYACTWDGSNHVGRVHGAGQSAIAEIERICESFEHGGQS